MKGNKKTKKLCTMCIAVFLMLSELSTMTVGAVQLEQNEEYQEQETEQEKETTEEETVKEKQELSLCVEEKRVSFGEQFQVKELLESNVELQDAELLLQEEPENGASILEIEEDTVRAIGVNQENGGKTILSIQLPETDTCEASPVVKLTVIVDKVTPKLSLCVENDHIPLYGKLQAKASLEKTAEYADLLEKDEKLRLHYEINAEDKSQELWEEPFLTKETINLESFVTPWYFRPFKRDTVFTLRSYMTYEDEYSPYELSELSSEIMLGACDAYMEANASDNGSYDYREDFYTTPVVTVDLKRNSLFTEHSFSPEEKEALTYTIISSDPQVAVPQEESYDGTSSELALILQGVGSATLTIRTTGGDIYQIEEKEIPIEVTNSTFREKDVELSYEDAEGNETQPVMNWINGSLSLGLSEEGKQYYSHIGYSLGDKPEEETELLCLEKEMPLQQLTYYTKHKERKASTGETPDGRRTIVIGIDKTRPEADRFTYNKNAFAPTLTPQKAYYAENFVMDGVFLDEASGIDKIQLTYDGTDLEKAKWIDIEQTWEKGATEVPFHISLGHGQYPALTVRAVDVAGNISEVVRVSENGRDYQEIVVDATEPLLEINASTEKQSYTGAWTNQPVICSIKEKQQKEMLSGIYQTVYQYVKAGDMYKEDGDWKPLETDTLMTGGSEKSDFCNQNGTYYFKAVSRSGVETTRKYQNDTSVRIRLQQIMPQKEDIIETKATGKRKNEWYNKKSGVPILAFAYPCYDTGEESKEYGAPMTVHTVLERESENGKKEKLENQAKIGIYEDGGKVKQDEIERLTITFDYDKKSQYAKDGVYTLAYWITDEAGNESEHEIREYKIDTHEPSDIHFILDGTELESGQESTVVYERFYQDAVFGEASAEFGISGMDALRVRKAKKVGEWNDHTGFASTNGKIELTPDTRCFLYVLAEDVAGNTAEIWTRGVVVDHMTPSGKQSSQLFIRPTGENENHFYKEDIAVAIELQDRPESENFSGLEQVTYKIGTMGETEQVTEEATLFDFSRQLPTEEEIIAAQELATSKLIDAAKNEGNEAFIEVTAKDRSGNTMTSREILQIDVTKPELEISFTDEDAVRNGRYFDHERTAYVTVKELNFDPALIELHVTKNGEEYPIAAGEWTTDGILHKTAITFTEDGDYVLWAEGKDLADNEAERVETELFTVDITKPVLQISYDNQEERLTGYYKRPRQATIQIVEHNFAEEEIKLLCEQSVSLSGWRHQGDVHTATISFTQDEEYQYEITGIDLAGNEIEPMTPESFTIDMTAPQLTVLGVADGSANKGSIEPQVVVQDTNLYPEGVHIFVKTGLGKDVPVEQQLIQEQTTYHYKLTNLSEMEDAIYYLTVEAEDKAGNLESLTYRYSLNRFGSTYDISAISRLVEQKYHRFLDMTDVEIIEMNVDRIEEYELYLSKNGRMLTAKEGKRPHHSGEEMRYEVEKTGNEQLGYTNIYRIYKENFEAEGFYNLTFYSKDRAGNEVNNTLADKDAKTQFVIDNTIPQVVLEGVENNQVYRTESKQVNVLVQDNFELKDAVFYLRNAEGNILQSWDYLTLTSQGEVVTIDLPSSDEKLSLTYQATDMAGNELVVLPENEEVAKGFFVTTNIWIQYIHSPKAIAGTIFLGMLATGGVLFVKRKQSLVKNK